MFAFFFEWGADEQNLVQDLTSLCYTIVFEVIYMWSMCICVLSTATYLNLQMITTFIPQICYLLKWPNCATSICNKGDRVLIPVHRWCWGFKPHKWPSASPGFCSQRKTQLPHGAKAQKSLMIGTQSNSTKHTRPFTILRLWGDIKIGSIPSWGIIGDRAT